MSSSAMNILIHIILNNLIRTLSNCYLAKYYLIITGCKQCMEYAWIESA